MDLGQEKKLKSHTCALLSVGLKAIYRLTKGQKLLKLHAKQKCVWQGRKLRRN
jgi:hypothetical protein